MNRPQSPDVQTVLSHVQGTLNEFFPSAWGLVVSNGEDGDHVLSHGPLSHVVGLFRLAEQETAKPWLDSGHEEEEDE